MLDSLKPSPGSRKPRVRKGRGPGSRKGRTCGRGQKGAGSRSGSKRRAYFEGGQMPLSRRLPKVGFFNISRVENQAINVRDLDGFDAGSVVDVDALIKAGIARSSGAPVKLLADGELSKALTIHVHGVSAAARKKVEAAGGSVELIAKTPKKKAEKATS